MATLPAGKNQGERLISLDVVRGIAVMGIFSVNVVAMAMIDTAYFYPPAYGFDGPQDRLLWLVNFLLIDGKLRSLFSMLFGASMLLVIERAVAAGRSPARTHYARMIVLLLLGFLHWLILWWGDILTHYAAVGMAAYLLWKLSARKLLIAAIAGFIFYAGPSIYFSWSGTQQFEQVEAGRATPEVTERIQEWRKASLPDAKAIAKDRAAHSSIAAHVRAAWAEGPITPLDLGPLWIETLSLMLLGMWGYKSGFLTGTWSEEEYRRVAVTGIGIGFFGYALAATYSWSSGFGIPQARAAYGGYTTLLRPLMACGYAALILLMVKPGGWLTQRFAAVGRTAFTNYIGCTIAGVLVFYGFAGDLYGKLSRFEAWLLVPPVWLLMLAWSKPWLDRFYYGPFEWLWRSLARMKFQPMRKRPMISDPVTAGA